MLNAPIAITFLSGAAFVILAIVNVGANLWGWLRPARFTKPLLMPLLAVLVTVLILLGNHQGDIDASIWLVYAGLFFGWIGDIALMYESARSFYLGLGAFLVGHLFYFALAVRWVILAGGAPPLAWAFTLVVAAIYTIFAVSFMRVYHRRDSLLATKPVLVYAYSSVIMLMSAAMLLAHLAQPNFGTEAAMWGAALFLISDTTLSKQMFFEHSSLRQGMLMCTYVSGQAMIALGTVFAGL
ncbi:hypothetical protein BSR29_01305 [Boudabousia liubingyangii]|uniref:Lysoplasmalogenase n=1 Tax=Boudabousia liubingyangii TaxID=1921764 RepID=A0A1Q5PQ22_9ACTO|nr:lysoplasmalogenase [Boudabousia liubingyangii]OKL48345.1 hypothetical protein BSR28_01175 [Boudabousia liubingyangii]OKL49623.1 hypothetical protein BSR29_01305 [Boudabousia liubingyangii]